MQLLFHRSRGSGIGSQLKMFPWHHDVSKYNQKCQLELRSSLEADLPVSCNSWQNSVQVLDTSEPMNQLGKAFKSRMTNDGDMVIAHVREDLWGNIRPPQLKSVSISGSSLEGENKNKAYQIELSEGLSEAVL